MSSSQELENACMAKLGWTVHQVANADTMTMQNALRDQREPPPTNNRDYKDNHVFVISQVTMLYQKIQEKKHLLAHPLANSEDSANVQRSIQADTFMVNSYMDQLQHEKQKLEELMEYKQRIVATLRPTTTSADEEYANSVTMQIANIGSTLRDITDIMGHFNDHTTHSKKPRQ